jgi:hypothetical protein
VPAARGKNLRSGDLAEQLGLLLLQSVALIAPVPRTEDVGIDVVVTLIRDFDSYRYIAEDSFFVQIKSSSVKTINFDKEQVAWLASLQLPFFIASVDRPTSTIDLYCAHRLSDAFIMKLDRNSLVIHLKEEENPSEFVVETEENIYVGPPILRWTINSIHEQEGFMEKFYRICKAHIEIVKETLETRRVGWVTYVLWRTNEEPKSIGWKTASSGSVKDRMARAYDLMMPYFSMWHQDILVSGDIEAASDVISLLEMVKEAIENERRSKLKRKSDDTE